MRISTDVKYYLIAITIILLLLCGLLFEVSKNGRYQVAGEPAFLVVIDTRTGAVKPIIGANAITSNITEMQFGMPFKKIAVSPYWKKSE